MAVSFCYLDVLATTTMEARRIMAKGQTDGSSLQAVSFSVGRCGFDPYDYLAVIPVNPDSYALDDEIFGDVIDHVEHPNAAAVSYYCLLESGEANETLGEVAIWGVVENAVDNPPSGTTVLMAVGHFPLIAKNSDMQYCLRVTMQA